MRLEWMELDRFRNLGRQTIQLHPRFNLLFGQNGQGKTNFLEAVAFLGSLRSFRAAGRNDLIGHGESMCRVSGGLYSTNLGKVLSFSLDHRGRTQFFDDRRVSSPEEYLRSVGTVHFVPEDVGLVGGPPFWRRKVLDRAVFETRPGYPEEYRRFLVALRQRNALFRKERILPEEKEGWDNALAETGSWVVKRRQDLLAALYPEMASFGERLGLGRGLHLKYLPSFERKLRPGDTPPGTSPDADRAAIVDGILEEIQRASGREKRSGHTLVGPHRDQVLFFLGGPDRPLDLARFGSQGQKRTAVLSFKLAVAAVVARAQGEWPLVILDDVSSELDEKRREALASIVCEMDAQFFISATAREDMALPPGEGRTWKVKDGILHTNP